MIDAAMIVGTGQRRASGRATNHTSHTAGALLIVREREEGLAAQDDQHDERQPAMHRGQRALHPHSIPRVRWHVRLHYA